ncbi:MAG: ABC transporter ATP-binding protein/permease [Acidimicrobiia bacterium]|nr:ABC transporter ATP-binding protein/permease [Acidimicrobiia bacterium]NNL27334.1 ABC transporter ATP-binding protein [Acidimicrobiia bacterium]
MTDQKHASEKAMSGPRFGQARPENSDPIASLSRLIRYLGEHRFGLILVIVLVVTSTALSLIGPWLQGVAIDEFIMNRDPAGLVWITVVLALTYVGMTLSFAGFARMMAAIAQRVMYRLRRELFEHMQELSLEFHDGQPTGELMSRLTNDVDAVDQLLSQNITSLLRNLFSIVGLVGFMVVLDWRLTLAAMAPVPLIFLVMRYIGRKAPPLFGTYQKDVGALNALAEETLAGQRVAIAFDRQAESTDAFVNINRAVRSAGTEAYAMTSVLMPVMFGIGNLGIATVAGIGAWLALTGGGVTVGLIATFISYSRQVARPLSQLGNTYTATLSALAGAERIFQILDRRPSVVNAADAIEIPEITGHVQFDEVDFAYRTGPPILKNVAFEAQPGDMIGLVGPTGAGKTTMISILARFYDIQQGSVRVDDLDVRSVTKDSLREQLGVVLQDTFLFSETVRDNIRYGRLDATDEEIQEAAQLANAHRFIQTLPNGYDTVLSEGAANLSLGQRQLIAIARAALASPRILILDEATSSVDTRTEAAIQQALLRLMKGRTSFVIAHRLSTVRDADQILVVDAGEVVESGTHDELVEADGTYARLYTSQFKGQDVM